MQSQETPVAAANAALTLALRKLIGELNRNDQLSKFAQILPQRKHYDAQEKAYIEKERLRKQLATEYQSSQSEEQNQESTKRLQRNLMKMQIKKNLVAAHFDSSLLKDSPAESEDGLEKVTTIKFLIDQGQNKPKQKQSDEVIEKNLNIIEEVKTLAEVDDDRETNFGLEFLIKSLQEIYAKQKHIELSKAKISNKRMADKHNVAAQVVK